MSEFFDDLLRKARQREAKLLHEMHMLWGQLNFDDFQACARMAEGMLEAHAKFIDGLQPVALRAGVDLRRNVCPCCGESDCDGAQNAHGLGGPLIGVIDLIVGSPQKPPQEPK